MDEFELQKHSVTLWGHRTSITLEKLFWDELKNCALEDNKTLKHFIEEVDEHRSGNLSSALRVYILKRLKNKKDERE
jgi:predicted DNA-binding ribbon-helix-helix protein